MSNHAVEVVPVVLEPHPNADSLSIIRIKGYSVCGRTSDWVGVTQGAFLPPDSIVPDLPEYAFLNGHRRIKVKKLRGVISMGLLVPAPAGSKIGDDVADILGITHYNQPEPLSTGGEAESPPAGYRPCYDIESLRSHINLFVPGELVFCSEKLEGCNARFCWQDDRMYCCSRTEWKRQNDSNLWWMALKATPQVEDLCRANPDLTAYGEVIGNVGGFDYGHAKGSVSFACFDLLRGSQWVDAQEQCDICQKYGVPVAPLLGILPFSFDTVAALAEGQTTVPGASHVREGCVVKPIKERTCLEIGRVQLKIKGNDYFMKA